MFCWGSTVNGELGLGGIEEELILAPRQLNSSIASEIAQVACGAYHTLAVTTTGKVYSCGNNDFSQLGHAKSCKKFELIDDLESLVITQASCGADFSVVLDEWGRVFCWGSDNAGQLGITSGKSGSTESKPKIVKGLATNAARVVQIATGRQHCLALTNTGELYAWGSNEHGQLGLGPNSPSLSSPSLISSLVGIPISFIACGANHSIAVTKSGAVYGWGKNTFGQLGVNDNADKLFPSHLNTLRTMRVKYVACGEDFTVFLTKDGGVLTSGAGTSGQLGHGALTNECLPRKVLELMGSVVSQVAAGRRHTLAFVPSRGRVYAFGLGGAGQLGTKVTGNASAPQVVLGPWASPSGICVLSEPPPGSTTLSSVSRIFAGGDRSFASVTCYLDHLSPADHRDLDPATQLLTIQQSRVAVCAEVGPDEAVNMDLVEYLELVFGSLNCVNGSFLTDDDAHYCCSVKNFGVDLAQAALAFQSLAETRSETVKELVLASVSSCLSHLTPAPLDLEALRVFVMLPLFTEFENPRHWKSLQNPFASALLALKPSAAAVVDKWWRLMTDDYFERLIRLYKNVVVHILMLTASDQRITDGCHQSLAAPLEILRKLNECNKSLDEPKVAYDSFYVPELTERVDIAVDYIRWLSGVPGRACFCNYSFLFDTVGKLCLLETDQSLQMRSAMSSAASRAFTTMFFDPAVSATITAFLELHVRRDSLVEDTLRELSLVRDAGDLKKPVKVTFFGEEAEDAGGVRKEFFLLLMSEILDPKFGMFRQYEETRTIWFSEDTLEEGIMYYLIGLLCGLAIYNFTIINLPFPLALYKKLLRERVTLQDLKGLSPTLANSFQDLLDYADDDFEQVFELNFEVTREAYGQVKTVPLKENGANIPVTQANKAEFVSLYVDLLLNKAVAEQFSSFDGGFHKVCGGRTLDLFHAQELMAVVVGNENYDWTELEHSAIYKNGYKATDLTIKLFWDVFHELTLDEKKKFLLFLTGSDRIPISGMKAIKIVIQQTGDDKFLPVAHTCFNLLDLPPYRTREKLRYKLLQAIQQTRGFSLV